MSQPTAAADASEEAARYRAAERAWQNEIGHTLLDKPHETPGSSAVFARQWSRIAAALRDVAGGPVVEVGCGKGHLLRWLRDDAAAPGRTFIGLDLSRAVFSLPAAGLAGTMADGEHLPLRERSVAALIYDGALHHLIDYAEALREALRVLAPGGLLILFEPVSSPFSRAVHHLLDPIVFRKTVYESPIDQRYKDAFDEEAIARLLAREGVLLRREHTDFLAYPLTGCYAGSVFSRRARLMRTLLALEDAIERTPGLRRLAAVFAWRFLIVARKEGP
jgi:ubiquinone/menaquinone biosynthesis C-methylase UbiE